MFPEQLRLKRDQKAAAQRAKDKCQKPWFQAQVRHYGIPSNSAQDTLQVLKTKLSDAVRRGLCDVIPLTVLHIEEDLSTAYWTKLRLHPEKIRIYERQVQDWEAAEERRKDAVFASLESQDKEAEYSPSRFVAKYFLDEKGEPDRARTRNILTLLRPTNPTAVEQAATAILGLEVGRAGQVGHDETLFIGWNKDSVQTACELLNQQSAERARLRKEQALKRFWAPHEELKRKSREKADFSLAGIAGSYHITCKYIEEQWEGQQMTLEINPPGAAKARYVEAGFDFSVLKGIFRLSLDEDFIHEACSDDDDHDDDDDVFEKEDELDKDDDDDEVEIFSRGILTSRKRKAQFEAQSAKSSGPPAKKVKKFMVPRRVYFKWRGQETGEGVIQLDDGGDNSGWIEFDPALTTFSGEFHSDLTSTCDIEGCKMSMEPRPWSESWSDFSESAYDDAKFRRWG